MTKKQIAILLPYKENYNMDHAGAASIWIKDYLSQSKLKDKTIVYGNLNKKLKPLTPNFKNIDLTGKIVQKSLGYTKQLYNDYLIEKYLIIEIHNRPESLLFLLNYFRLAA